MGTGGPGHGNLRDALRVAARHGWRLPALVTYGAVLLTFGALAELGGELVTLLLVPVVALTSLLVASQLRRTGPGVRGWAPGWSLPLPWSWPPR